MNVGININSNTIYDIMKTFTGTSSNTDLTKALSEALGNAISRAAQPPHNPDAQVTWTIEKISGKHGGFAPKTNELSVTIAAKT